MELNREKLADFIGVSLRTIDEYARQGMPGEPPKRKGDTWRFDSAACVAWLRERERSSVLGEVAKVDEAEAKRRKLAAEAALAELELAKAQGEVVAIADFSNAASQVIGSARAKLLGLGAKLGRLVAVQDDVAECAALIDSGVSEALQELSDFEPDIPIDECGPDEPEGRDSPERSPVGPAAGPDGKRVGRRGAPAKSGKQRRAR